MIIIAPLTIHLCLFNIKLQKKTKYQRQNISENFCPKKRPKVRVFFTHTHNKSKKGENWLETEDK